MYAAYLGHHKLCEELLARAAKIEALNENGQDALMLAASCGSVDTVLAVQALAQIISRSNFS